MDQARTISETGFQEALDQLTANKKTIADIAQFCSEAYVPGKEAEVFGQTKEYTTNALLNVAYHIQNVVARVQDFLQLQSTELDRLDLQVRTINERVRTHLTDKGQTGSRPEESRREYHRTSKIVKLEGDKLPEMAKPLPRAQLGEFSGESGVTAPVAPHSMPTITRTQSSSSGIRASVAPGAVAPVAAAPAPPTPPPPASPGAPSMAAPPLAPPPSMSAPPPLPRR
eukprot:m51a1_g14688 hypothetical protein (227) ;mRNA; f:98314-99429